MAVPGYDKVFCTQRTECSASYLKSEIAKWAKVVKESGAKVE
jgi:hypothetical protein